MNTLDSTLFYWGIALIIGVPVLTIALGEISDRLVRRDSNYVRSVNLLRSVVLPVGIAFAIVRQVLALDADNELRRLVASVALICCAWVGFIIVGAVNEESDPTRWENHLPGLFKTLARVAVVVYPLYVLTEVWGLALSSAVTALGVGSLVIAFALQDTLSSIVSGFLLVADKPFAVGDWITVDDYTGQVIDVSWRSTRLEVDGHDVVVIPNVNLASSSIHNHSTATAALRDDLTFGFDGDHPPNQVKQMLLDVARDCPHVVPLPASEVHLSSYDNYSNAYTLVFYLDSYRSDLYCEQVRDDIRSRLFYAAERAHPRTRIPRRPK